MIDVRLRNRFGVFALTTLLVVCTPAALADGEKRVSLKEVPAPVRDAAQRATAVGKLHHIDLEQENGRDLYSVHAKIAGKDVEFEFAADGTLVAQEQDIAYAEVPEAARRAAEKYFGSAAGLNASKEIADGVTSYEVEGKKGGKEYSLTLDATGAILEEESEDDDSDD